LSHSNVFTNIIYSPYLLNEARHDLSLSLGRVGIHSTLQESHEKVEFVLQVDGRSRWTSGFLSLDGLRKLDTKVRFSAHKRSRIRTLLVYRRQIKGVALRTSQSLTWKVTKPVNGFRYLLVKGSQVQVSSAVMKMQARVARRVKLARRTFIRSPVSSTLRPNPEIINKQFLRVAEVGNQGTLQPAQSTRVVMPILSFRRDWTGTRTPGFRTKKPKQLPVNPHTVTILEVLDDRYTRYQVNTITGDHALDHRPFSDVYALPGHQDLTPYKDKAAGIALQRLISRAQLGIQANFAQNLAQMNQLTALVAGNATRIVKSLRALRRFNFTGAVNALTSGRGNSGIVGGGLSTSKSVASNWLQLQYGWKPLLKDIENFFNILPTSFEQGSTVHRVTGTGSFRNEIITLHPPGDAQIGESHVGRTTRQSRSSVRYGISYRVDDPMVQFFSQLGFTNPINLAWEVLPFSFVADWFLPIGSYLEQASAFHGLTFLDGYKTTFTREKMDSANTYGGSVVGVPQTLINFGCSYRRERITLTRERLTAFPGSVVPSLTLNPFENSGSAAGTNNRAWNAIALLTQTFK
jgi:hypothetical protein